MGYTMKGSPAKLGTIQGTSGHASALKQMDLSGGLVNLEKKKKKKGKSDYELGLEAGKLESDIKNLDTSPGDKKKKVDPSEKTKSLRSKVEKKDVKTELTRAEKEKAEKKEGKYGKGLFGGAIRRGRAKRKHKRASRKEDKTREQLAKSESWDQLSPDEKTAKTRERMAYLTAMFNEDAATMANIARGNYNKAKQEKDTEKPSKSEIKVKQPFVQGAAITFPSSNIQAAYDEEPGAGDLPKQKEGEV